jgi:NAD(P)-dependent dehydrogenase (short-subunit alcohol dehydrogenase family)
MNANGTRRLEGKSAVIFGAGGDVGATVAKEFAAQGARCFLSGRSGAGVKDVAEEISTAGATATVAEVDALDEEAVTSYVDDLAATVRIDVVFNAMGPQPAEYRHGTPAIELSVGKFTVPLTTIVPSNFITARAVARHLIAAHSGVILFLSGTVALGRAPGTSAIGSAFGAVETLTRSLATELGPLGVRVACVRSAGMPDTRTIQQTFEMIGRARGVPKERLQETLTSQVPLGRWPSVVETAKLLSFLASDEASAMTGAIVNSSCGQVLD